jgi:N6-L-threonylcarbamoyladenine synthase
MFRFVGAAVEKMAQQFQESDESLAFPIPLRDGRDKPHQRLCFSFSGIKASVDRHVTRYFPNGSPIPQEKKAQIAFAFQEACFAHISDRLQRALKLTSSQNLTCVVLSGGVASNVALRKKLEKLVQTYHLPLIVPPPTLCTDNAAMVAWTGLERLQMGCTNDIELDYLPKWSLETLDAQEGS